MEQRRAVYKINEKECMCPFSQEAVDRYEPGLRTLYIQYRPQEEGVFYEKLEEFAELLGRLWKAHLITRLYRDNKNEWLVDVYDGTVLELLRTYFDIQRCKVKVVDIYKEKMMVLKE